MSPDNTTMAPRAMTHCHSPQQPYCPEFLLGVQLQRRPDPYRQQDSPASRYHPDFPDSEVDHLVHTWPADSGPFPAAHAA